VPQFSIHRGDLQMVLLDAFVKRAGADKVITGWRCTRVEHEGPEAVAHFEDVSGKSLPPQRGSVVVSAEGIHSVSAQAALSERGAAKIFRHQHVARGHALEAIPFRRQHDPHWLAPSGEAFDLSHPEQCRCGWEAASELGVRH
jgi:hypothetical protein